MKFYVGDEGSSLYIVERAYLVVYLCKDNFVKGATKDRRFTNVKRPSLVAYFILHKMCGRAMKDHRSTKFVKAERRIHL